MRAFYLKASLAASLALATYTTAFAAETFPDPDLSYGLQAGTATSQALISDCLGEDSSSRAVRACTKILRDAGPDETVRSQILARRGLHQMALGRFDAASEDFARSGDLADHDGLASLGQGFAAMMQNDVKSARALFEDCNKNSAVAPLAEYGLGLTYQMSGQSDDARQAFERAIALRPGWDAPVEQLATLD